MALGDLLNKLKTKDITGVYLFYGDEEYTKDFYIKKLRAICQGTHPRECCRAVFDRASLNPDALADAVLTPPFMGDRKIIEINNFQLNQPAPLLARYMGILEDVPKGVCAVFIYRSGEFDLTPPSGKGANKNEFADFLFRSCIDVEFAPEKGFKLIQWIQKHFDAEKVAVTEEAVKFLPDYCGNDMYVLAGEIDKLCAVRPQNSNVITVADIEAVCCSNAEYRLYDIVNCLAEGNATKLKKVYDGLVYNKTRPELMLGAIAGYFADLLVFKAAFAESRPMQELKNKLGYGDFQANRLISASRKADERFIANGIKECRETDIIVKSHASDSYSAIEIMLYRIMAYGK